MKRLHYLQHVPFEGLGKIQNWAASKNWRVTSTPLYENPELPGPDQFDLLVIMGGPMNIYEEQKYPWLAREKKLIQASLKAKKKILGICLGAQLIADALGARVTQNPIKEIGWHPVTLTSQGREQPFFQEFPPIFEALHWHGDTFQIPKGAVHLAKSEACPNQAFSVGTQVLALQFHLDYGLEELTTMTEECPEDLATPGPAVQTAESMLSQSSFFPKTESRLERLLDQFWNASNLGGNDENKNT